MGRSQSAWCPSKRCNVEAREIGDGTPHAEAMSACDARFEVSIGDFEKSIDEINTMMSLQGALQDVSVG